MKKKEILVICSHPGILATLIRLIEKTGEFTACGVATAAEALSSCRSRAFDLILMGAGLAPEAEQDLERKLKEISPESPVIYHFGGGSGLLFTEIKQGLDQA